MTSSRLVCSRCRQLDDGRFPLIGLCWWRIFDLVQRPPTPRVQGDAFDIEDEYTSHNLGSDNRPDLGLGPMMHSLSRCCRRYDTKHFRQQRMLQSRCAIPELHMFRPGYAQLGHDKVASRGVDGGGISELRNFATTQVTISDVLVLSSPAMLSLLYSSISYTLGIWVLKARVLPSHHTDPPKTDGYRCPSPQKKVSIMLTAFTFAFCRRVS